MDTLCSLTCGGLRRADHRRDDVAGLVVAGIADLGIAGGSNDEEISMSVNDNNNNNDNGGGVYGLVMFVSVDAIRTVKKTTIMCGRTKSNKCCGLLGQHRNV